MPLFRAGSMIWNPSIFKCSRNARSERKNVALLHDQDISTLVMRQKTREWRHSELGWYGASLSRLSPYIRENEMISRRRVPFDQHQKHHLQKFSQVGFTRQMIGHRKLQFQDLHRVGTRPGELKLSISRLYRSLQDAGIKSQASELECGAEFEAVHPIAKLQGKAAKAITSSIEGSLMRFSSSKKQSNSKFSLRAVTDEGALPHEGKDNHGLDENKDQSDQIEKTQEKTVRSGGQILGSYATTTAIAIQDSLPPEGFVVLMSCAVGLMTGVCVVLFNLGRSEMGDDNCQVLRCLREFRADTTKQRAYNVFKFNAVITLRPFVALQLVKHTGFNAAVAGCFFAVESVLPGLSSANSAPSLTTAMVLLSSVLASVVSQAGLGSDPAFRIPAYDFRSPTELPLYLLLGVLCGGVSVGLVKGTAYATTMFELLQKATSLPAGFLPPLGGLCVGVIALVYPEVLYWGFENVDVLLESHLPWIQGPQASLLLQLVGAKLVATALCRGSGLVGGVYASSLFIGAALGSAYGSLASYASTHADPKWHLDILQVAAPQAYALVGMAATLAGVCQVPLTSVLLLFELTRDYRIILPLMGAVGLSSWVASSLQRKKVPVVQMEAPLTPVDVLSMTRFRGGPGSQTLDAALITNSKQPVSTAAPLMSGRISREKELCNLEDTLCLTKFEGSEDHLAGEILVIFAMRTISISNGRYLFERSHV